MKDSSNLDKIIIENEKRMNKINNEKNEEL